MDTTAPRQISGPLVVGLIFMPIVFWWFLLAKGFSAKARMGWGAWAAVILAGVIVGAGTDTKAAEGPQPFKQAVATRSDVDRLTTYAVLLGRAIGCGLDVSYQSARVGAWLDRVAPPGSPDQQTMLTLLMTGMRTNAQAQTSGRSPDDCGAVARAVRNHPWP